MKLLKFLFWNFVYFFRKTPKDLKGWVIRFERRRNPYKKFKPNVFFNKGMNEWQVYLADVRSITWPLHGMMRMDVMVDIHTGEIVGFDIRKEQLEQLLAETKAKYESMSSTEVR